MKINRVGAQRHHGHSSINLNNPLLEWDSSRKCITLEKFKIKDFITDSKHDYTVEIELSEIGSILDLIAREVISKDPDHLIHQLSPSTVKILKILTVLANAPEPSEDE